MTKNPPPRQPENREAREAAALRENLLKRKQQQRALEAMSEKREPKNN
jgi:hypothetical protein